MDPTEPQIVISRPSRKYRDSARRYRIEIDGVRVADISPGEEISLPVSEGDHTVQARIDWSGSPQVVVTATRHRVARLVVRPAGTALTAMFQIFGRTGYLKLEWA